MSVSVDKVIIFSNRITPTEVPTSGEAYFWMEGDSLKYKASDNISRTLSTGITAEEVQDIVGALITGSGPINVVYDDLLNAITISLTQSSISHTNIANIGTNTHAQIDSHIASTLNPHATTKAQVGLSAVPNVDATNPANITQSASFRFVTDTEKTTWDAKEPGITAGTITQYWRGDKSWQTLDKAAVGLSLVPNVDATARSSHTGTQLSGTISDFTTSVDARITAQKGVANGVATLDATVKVPVIQIPALPYAPTSHTHVVADITDFTTGVTTITNPLYATIGHTHADATTVASGFMSAADKVKLDGITNDIFYKTTAALTNSSNSTLTSITELGIPVVAGNAYRFRFWILYRSTQNTTGLVVAMTNTAGATGTLSANLRNNTSTTAASLSTLSAFNTILTYTSTPTANTDFVAQIEGIFVCTASGNIVPQFRSETNGQTITVQVNSIAEVKQL